MNLTFIKVFTDKAKAEKFSKSQAKSRIEVRYDYDVLCKSIKKEYVVKY